MSNGITKPPQVPPPSRIVVIGGGITGLATAHRLVELGADPVVIERAPRCGGVVLTERIDGFLVEAGPDSFLARKPWASDLCRRVGLGDDLMPTDPTHRGSFIWSRGRLHALPEGLTSLVPTRLGPIARTRLLSPVGKMRLMLEPFVPRGPEGEDESLAAFFRRRLGVEASRELVEPLVRGIYGGDAGALSLLATFPQLASLERRHGSLIVGLLRQARAAGAHSSAAAEAGGAAFLSLSDGMGSLVDRLLGRLPPGAVQTGTAAAGLLRMPAGNLGVELEDGEIAPAAAVIVTTPPAESARLLGALDPELASLVGGIASGSSVTVALGFERSHVGHRLDAYGFIVPETDPGPLLACTWASSKFPGRAPGGAVLLRAFLGDAERLLDESDTEVAELALDALRPILDITAHPHLARVHRWRDALPRYVVGHPARIAAIERRLAGLPGLFLAGAAYRGLGIPDCVRDGEAAAEAAVAHGDRTLTAASPGS